MSGYVSARLTFLVLVLLLFANSCTDDEPLQDLDGEVGFLFGIWYDTTGVEDFIAVTKNEGVIAIAREQLLLPASQRTYHIHGLITHGNGGHNLDWQWHFLPSEWALVEESTEVCDAIPSAAMTLLDNLPDTLTTAVFCPLSSYVKAEIQ